MMGWTKFDFHEILNPTLLNGWTFLSFWGANNNSEFTVNGLNPGIMSWVGKVRSSGCMWTVSRPEKDCLWWLWLVFQKHHHDNITRWLMMTSAHSDDVHRSGCRKVSQRHHKQSFSGLHSTYDYWICLTGTGMRQCWTHARARKVKLA